MHKVTVLYPKSDDSTFDMEYYKTVHRDLVVKHMDVERFDIDEGLDGPYMAMGHLYWPTAEAMQAGMSAPGTADTAADVKNFTNVQPQFQVSQVID